MADENDTADETEGPAPKKSKLGVLIGLVLALVLGGGGFFAVYSGMILGDDSGTTETAGTTSPVDDLPPVGFVALDPLVVSLGRAAEGRHLRFRAQLEIDPDHQDDVTKLIPRVMDVLNSYLRAVSLADLEDPASLVTLRAQMLRRVQLVTGDGRVRDLLIMEFVLN